MRGVVTDKSGKYIEGAMIVLNGGVRVFTLAGGFFHALLAPGNHNIEAVADGYQQQRQEVGCERVCGGVHLCLVLVNTVHLFTCIINIAQLGSNRLIFISKMALYHVTSFCLKGHVRSLVVAGGGLII